MKKRVTILLLFFFTSISIYGQWASKKDTVQLPNWSKGECIDAISTGAVIFSNGYFLFISSDNGTNWTEIPRPGAAGEIIDVSIVNNSAIWIATQSPGKIFKTTDNGINWELQFYDTTKTNFINYIKMFDENNGIAMGDALIAAYGVPVFLKTTNSGKDWVSMNNYFTIGGISGSIWQRLDFVNENTGYFYPTGNDPQKLYKTPDGGASWIETNYTGLVQIVKFYNQNLGLTFSYKYDTSTNPPTFPSFFRRTTDGGDTWEEFQVDIDSWGNDIEFVPGNPANVWFTNYNSFYYSVDTGKTWQEYDLGVDSVKGRDIVFTDANHGWLLCDNGNIYYTENNGGIITGIDEENTENKIPQNFILYQNYPNPFNPSTKIKFTISNVTDANFASAKVQLIVYDLLGRETAVLVNEEKKPGVYEVEFDANNLSSGIYYYKLTAGGFAQTRKMIFLK